MSDIHKPTQCELEDLFRPDEPIKYNCLYCLDTGERHNGYFSYPCNCKNPLYKQFKEMKLVVNPNFYI